MRPTSLSTLLLTATLALLPVALPGKLGDTTVAVVKTYGNPVKNYALKNTEYGQWKLPEGEMIITFAKPGNTSIREEIYTNDEKKVVKFLANYESSGTRWKDYAGRDIFQVNKLVVGEKHIYQIRNKGETYVAAVNRIDCEFAKFQEVDEAIRSGKNVDEKFEHKTHEARYGWSVSISYPPVTEKK